MLERLNGQLTLQDTNTSKQFCVRVVQGLDGNTF